MGRIRKHWLAWILLPLAAAGPGCNGQDRDRLARMGRTAVTKAQALTGGAHGKLATRWQAVRADLDEMALDARISARLRWDKSLADAKIDVSAEGGQVELHGKVADLAQRQRAVELAESTVGAEKVVDHLQVPEKEP